VFILTHNPKFTVPGCSMCDMELVTGDISNNSEYQCWQN